MKNKIKTGLFEIVGRSDSEFAGVVFGHFTTEELANAGHSRMPEEFQDETEVRKSNLAVNTIEVDRHVIDLAETKEPEEIIAARDENNRVSGYVSVHISDIINRDLEGFLDLISEKLIGSDLLMDINYDVVGMNRFDPNVLVIRVTGDVSYVIE